MFTGFIAGLSSIALLTLIFTGPTWVAARFFDAGHRSMARAALATAAGTASGFVAAGLFGSGMVSVLLFVGAAAAVVMVVLDLNLPRAVGTVLLAGALLPVWRAWALAPLPAARPVARSAPTSGGRHGHLIPARQRRR
jgi:hypothetical protein